MAENLHKFVYEIEEMPADEYDDWFAYFDWKAKEEKKAQEKAQRKSKSGGKHIQTY